MVARLSDMIVVAYGGIMREYEYRKTGFICAISIIVIAAAMPVFFAEDAGFVNDVLRHISNISMGSLAGLERFSVGR